VVDELVTDLGFEEGLDALMLLGDETLAQRLISQQNIH
jgi:hypothetical protein